MFALDFFKEIFALMIISIPVVNFSHCPHHWDLFDTVTFSKPVVNVTMESPSISHCSKAVTSLIALVLSIIVGLTFLGKLKNPL